MSKKSKTVYNLEDETVVIKIDAKTRDCVCKHEEKHDVLPRKNKQQVYQQHTTHQPFQLPFRQDDQQVYPVSVTVEKKPRKSSDSSRSDPFKNAIMKNPEILRYEQEPKLTVSNDYEEESIRNSSLSSKSTKSSSIDDRERVTSISEGSRSYLDAEENVHVTPINHLNRTEVDLSVSNIEIAHYPFKYSERSPSLVSSPPTPRDSKGSDPRSSKGSDPRSSKESDPRSNKGSDPRSSKGSDPRSSKGSKGSDRRSSKGSDPSERLPFTTDTRPVMMRALVTNEDLISSSNSESTISVLDINNAPLPLIQPRDHGPHCAIEVNVLEKHKDGCTNRKEIVGQSIEDKVGSYDVVSRVVYRTCGPDKKLVQSYIKNSLKSYHLDNPEFFGKDLQETRSRVETIPILPNYKCVLTADFPRAEKPFSKITSIKKPSIESEDESVAEHDEIANLTTFQPPPEVLSVYIRTDRSERVPDGFQKMHYRGDSCKLHDPEERTKQILQLQKVIEETSSEAYLSKSPRQFEIAPDPQVMAATAVADNPIPIHAVVAPEIVVPSDDDEEEEEADGQESLDSLEDKDHDDDDSLDRLPPHVRIGNDEMIVSRAGLFNCFRRNKQKRQREDSIEYVRNLSRRQVTHSDNQPKRHNEENAGSSNQRKLSGQYKR